MQYGGVFEVWVNPTFNSLGQTQHLSTLVQGKFGVNPTNINSLGQTQHESTLGKTSLG